MANNLDANLPAVRAEANVLIADIPAVIGEATASSGEARFGARLQLYNTATSQYGNFNFNSMAVFNGVAIGAGVDGVFSLFDAENDNGAYIESIIETVLSNFGVISKKKPRRLYLSLEASGSLLIKLKVDGGDYSSYSFTPKQLGQLQHRTPLSVSTFQKGDYWMMRIENIDGIDFSIDDISALFIISGMER